uniref:Interleukin 9 receptor n=1 Tax=Nannospalax galili TaxID=1026970 RepID=A0A8C6RP48_NANGA
MAPGRCTSEVSLAGWTLEREALKQALGIWLLIYTCVCPCVCWGCSVPEQGGLKAGTFTCLSNSILRIDCHWSGPELAEDSRAWLLFTSNQVTGIRHKCMFWGNTCTLVLPPEEVLLQSDNFTITFHRYILGQEQVSLVDSQYMPWRYVKLDPPSDLQSNVSSEHCVLTWSISPFLEPMIPHLNYELAFKRQKETWEQARHKDHIVGVTWLKLEAIELNPGSTYEARLRVHMALLEDDMADKECFKGQWSEWSQSVLFSSPQKGLLIPPSGWSDSTLVTVSIFLLLSGLTHFLFKLSPRVKRIFYQNVPSPAAFFHPLYSVHNGDFQTWIGAHRTGLQPTQDGVNTPPGGSESSIWEAITVLTYSPACPWQFSSLEEEGTGSSFLGHPSSEHVLPAGCVEFEGQPSAYLPQEDWAPVCPTRPAPQDSEGSSSSGYCILHFPENTQGLEPLKPEPVAFPVSSRA